MQQVRCTSGIRGLIPEHGGRGGSGGPAMVADSLGGTGAAGDTFDVELR